MPRSVSGTRQSNRVHMGMKGFSLIEIMVVLFVIGIAVGTATLSLRADGSSELRDEAEHFLLSARFVSEQAVLNREIIGMFVEPSDVEGSLDRQWCYEWRRYMDQRWVAVTDYLERRCLPADLQLELVIEGEPFEYDPDETSDKPVVVFYPSGEATPFELALIPDDLGAGNEQIQRIEVDMVGEIRWRNDERAREQEEQALWQ